MAESLPGGHCALGSSTLDGECRQVDQEYAARNRLEFQASLGYLYSKLLLCFVETSSSEAQAGFKVVM